MRKYSIPKIAYVLLVLMLACLSVGYTYAYFSATATMSNDTELGKISIVWRATATNSSGDNKTGQVSALFNDSSNISILTKLKRGGYSKILATDKEESDVELKLQFSNSAGTVPAYCRLKIEASYTPLNGTKTTCDPGWIQLALGDEANKEFITDFEEYGWFYDEYTGYYYFGSKEVNGEDVTIELYELGTGSRPLANYIYLDNSAPSEILGATVNITLKLEGVQTTNDAYKQPSIWGVNW